MHGRFSIEARGLTRVLLQVAAGTFKQGSMKLFTSLRSRKIIYKYCLRLQTVYTTNLIFQWYRIPDFSEFMLDLKEHVL